MNYTVHVQPGGHTFMARADETVLAAALRQGYHFPYSCQQAICGACQGQLIEGEVHYDVPIYAISDAEREMGVALFCSAKPLSDLVIHVEGMAAPTEFAERRLPLDVENIRELSGHVSQVILKQPQDAPFAWHAGQYIEVLHLDASPRPFSIANAPNSQILELHIRHLPDNLKAQKQLRISGPYGAMRYQHRPAWPLILLAGGTGFAPCKALIEQALRDATHQPIFLYWGARTREDLYWHEEILTLMNHHPGARINYTPVLSQPHLVPSGASWTGRVGLVHDIALEDYAARKYAYDLAHAHVYASGPPELVYAAHKAFVEHGLPRRYFYSDLMD